MKEHVQRYIDEIVKEYKDSGMISTYFGVPLSDFTKEELIAIIHRQRILKEEANNETRRK